MSVDHLYRQLLDAFPPEAMPVADGVDDLFDPCQEAYTVFPLVAGVRWNELRLPWAYMQDVLYFSKPVAMRYYLPAFLLPALYDEKLWRGTDWGAITMTRFYPSYSPGKKEREQNLRQFEASFSDLSSLQRDALRDVLAWIVKRAEVDEDFPSITENALHTYWSHRGHA